MKTELIPVIHKLSDDQVNRNVETCIYCGINKVFLIDHSLQDSNYLIDTARQIKEKYNIWVGVNLLGVNTESALMLDLPLDGLWCDRVVEYERTINLRQFKGQFFGSLAFKYQPQPADLAQACDNAKKATDVATTSGPATGKEASLTKIQTLRNFLGEHPLAIASGVNVENVHNYVGLANYLLVASSITDSSEIIMTDKLDQLNTLINLLNVNK